MGKDKFTKESLFCLKCRLLIPWFGKHYSLPFLPATPSHLSRTPWREFSADMAPIKGPRLALWVACKTTENQGNRQYVRCGTEALRHLQEQLTQTLIVFVETALLFVVPKLEGPLLGPSLRPHWLTWMVGWHTTLQSVINTKHSKHWFWHCHENRLNQDESNNTPKPIFECQVSIPLLWIKDYSGLS